MKKNIIIFIIFAILISTTTFPLVFKITTHIPGFFSSDESYGSIWNSWRIKYSIINHASLTHTQFIAYPYGMNLYSSSMFFYLWLAAFNLLSFLTTPILTYNIIVLIGLFLSAIFAYILILYLTKNKLSSIFGAIIFAFCPYQFARIWQHPGLTQNGWIPFAVFTAFFLKDRLTLKSGILFVAGLAIPFYLDWTVTYFVYISIAVLLGYVIAYNWRVKFKNLIELKKDASYFKRIILFGLIAFAICLPQIFPFVKNAMKISLHSQASAFNAYHRSFEDLFSQSAKPLSYFLPAAVHPVFGKFTEQFIGSPLYGESFTEHTLYLGWIPIILAFVAIRRWKRNRKKQGQSPSGTVPVDNDNFYIGFFIFLAIVAWLFSQPPWWKFGSIRIFMPSFFMYRILPMYRAYCRFGIVVMLAVAVLAGFGLKFILERFKSQKTKIVITCLFSGLVLFEFWNWPPYKVIDVSRVPAVYYWLKSNPGDFAVAEYPLDDNGPNEMYKFYQTTHEKKIINGTIPGTYANDVAKTITRLSEPKTASILKWMGVKYVIVHRDEYLRTGLIDELGELSRIGQSPYLRLIKSFPEEVCPNKQIMCVQKTGPIDVYSLESIPSPPAVSNKREVR